MGSVKRKMQREALKKAHKLFKRSWHHERDMQRDVFARGELLPEGQQQLGRAPTFSMYIHAVKEASERAAKEAAEKKDERIPNLDWDED
jgi:hypothetical protein